MLAECGIHRLTAFATPACQALGRFMRALGGRARWRAQPVRFPVMRLPCVQVLGLRAPPSLSALGRQVAMLIARDECTTLVLATRRA